jgi:hypothetical protein
MQQCAHLVATNQPFSTPHCDPRLHYLPSLLPQHMQTSPVAIGLAQVSCRQLCQGGPAGEHLMAGPCQPHLPMLLRVHLRGCNNSSSRVSQAPAQQMAQEEEQAP